jgi:hypothetical protein
VLSSRDHEVAGGNHVQVSHQAGYIAWHYINNVFHYMGVHIDPF